MEGRNCHLRNAVETPRLGVSASLPGSASDLMKISSVELREIHLPLVHFFETSFGRTCTRKIILVVARSEQVVGYGECTAAENPFYNSETTETAWHILSDFVIP